MLAYTILKTGMAQLFDFLLSSIILEISIINGKIRQPNIIPFLEKMQKGQSIANK